MVPYGEKDPKVVFSYIMRENTHKESLIIQEESQNKSPMSDKK